MARAASARPHYITPSPQKGQKKTSVYPPRIRGLEKNIKKITGSFFRAFLGRGIDIVTSRSIANTAQH
jgi:hypothetical protein